MQVNRIDIPAAVALGNTGTVPVLPNAIDGEDLTVPPGDQAKLAYDTLTPPQEFWIKRIVGDVDLSSFLRYNFSSQNPQLGHQLAAKKLAARYEYSRMLINGIGGGQNDPQFKGLSSLGSATASQALSGTNNIPDDLDALISRVRVTRPDAQRFVAMNFNTFATYQFQLRAAGARLELVHDELAGRMIPAHQGWPIYRSQFIFDDSIPIGPTFNALLLAGTFGYPDGVIGLYQNGRGQHGMQVEHANSSPTRDDSTARVAWHCGLALLSATSLAVMKEPAVPSLTPLR